jgi:hypothetical protein
MPFTLGWAIWLPVVVALAALAAGWALGRFLGPFSARGKDLSLAEGLPRALGDLAGEDFDRVRRERGTVGQSERSMDGSGATAERARLVASCADLADRLRDRQPALYAKLTRDLAAVGVTVETADGERFDAERHNPVGTEPTAEPTDDLRVATTVRVGYSDHGVVVRSPDVIVYRASEDGHGR